jgi:catechol O-methyltransferase
VEQVFRAIDGYCWEEQWMFNLGDVKGSIVDGVVAEWVRGRASEESVGRPVRGVEFGSFVGYSAMRVARHLPPGSEFTCAEPNYARESFRATVDKILSLAGMGDVIKYRPEPSTDAISAFAAENAAFDIVTTDHIKEDYLPTLKKMISLGQLRIGGLYLADNVVYFSLVDLLEYLRFSGDFVDYRLYYAAVEYDDFHGQPNAKGAYYPDGVVSAVYAGPGRGHRFESPGQSVCSRFKDCSTCLANLCAWRDAGGSRFKLTTVIDAPPDETDPCSRSMCVPDALVEAHNCSTKNRYTRMIGLSSGDMKCPNSFLGPMAWVGPEDASGRLRWQRIPGGRLNAGYYSGFLAESGNIRVDFFYPGQSEWGPIEVLWEPPDGRSPVSMGLIEPGSTLGLDAVDGHTFVTKCASGVPRGETEYTLQRELDGRQVNVTVAKKCSRKEEL